MTIEDHTIRVLIVGAGPTGLTVANFLGQAGVDAIIIDRKQGTVSEPRAVSIDDESLRTMQAIGLDEAVLRDVVPGYGVHYFNRPGGHCFGKVEPTSMLYGFPKRNAFRQPLLEATLRDGMARFDTLRVWFNHELVKFTQDERGVTASIRNAAGNEIAVHAEYLVACDGGRSLVRKQLGIAMVGSSFQSRWLVIDTDHDDDPFWQTRVYCDARRPVVDVPGPHRTRRFELMLKPHETDEEMLADTKLHELLRPFRGDKPISLVRKIVYTFHARVAERWRAGRVFLAGDAAHLTPPYAGQGMNSGIRDAHNLSWKLIHVLSGTLASQALDSYEQERRAHAWAMIKLALNLGTVMAPATILGAACISGIFRAIAVVPPLRDYFLQMRFKPKPRLAQGLVLSGGVCGNYRVGEMFPQPRLFDSTHDSILLDSVIGAGFALIQYGARELAHLGHPLWRCLAVKRIQIVEPNAAMPNNPGDCSVLHDREGNLNFARFTPGVIFLVRPDRYIAAIFAASEEHRIARALVLWFGLAADADGESDCR